MKRKKILSLLLITVMLLISALSCYGETTQEKINSITARRSQTQSSYEATQSRINALESKKGELEAYLTELNAQLTELTTNMETLQTQYQEKQTELLEIQEQLAVAKAQEAEQYESMKLRIQYIYENGGLTYIEMLFGAEDFTDLLNKAEQISQITSYDREMLKVYVRTKNEIAEREAEVEAEKEAIAVLQAESQVKQEEITSLVQATYDQIADYELEITEEESAAGSLLAQVRAQEDTLNELLKQAKDEEASRNEPEESAPPEADDEEPEQSNNNEQEETPSEEPEEEPDSSDDTSNRTYLGKFRLTAYCKCARCCGQWANGVTASGTVPAQGRTVAMGGVPFGTKLLINGNVYIVEDRGTAYGHVDIYHETHAAALQFGSRYADVYMIE